MKNWQLETFFSEQGGKTHNKDRADKNNQSVIFELRG